jgi:hypothetical protein
MATTAPEGTFRIEIDDHFCHTAWIFPPLGVLGGSLMNDLKEVRVKIKIAGTTRFDEDVPVSGRSERDKHPYFLGHPLPDLRVGPVRSPDTPTLNTSKPFGK